MKERLNNDLKEAMRNKDTARRDAIRFLLSAVRNAEIEKGGELDESDINTLLQKQAKQRMDSIAAYEEGGRSDLAEKERADLQVIEAYLPKQLDEEELRQIVRAEIERAGATSAKNLGQIMGPLMGKLRGRADGATVQRIAREELSG